MKKTITNLETGESFSVLLPEEMVRCMDYVAEQVAKRTGVKNYEVK
tara:strand:- start:475 stop:612 length:138 start_codon:yes stop_codon:yes gene_type:complete